MSHSHTVKRRIDDENGEEKKRRKSLILHQQIHSSKSEMTKLYFCGFANAQAPLKPLAVTQ